MARSGTKKKTTKKKTTRKKTTKKKTTTRRRRPRKRSRSISRSKRSPYKRKLLDQLIADLKIPALVSAGAIALYYWKPLKAIQWSTKPILKYISLPMSAGLGCYFLAYHVVSKKKDKKMLLEIARPLATVGSFMMFASLLYKANIFDIQNRLNKLATKVATGDLGASANQDELGSPQFDFESLEKLENWV